MSRQPLALDFFLIAHDPFDEGRLRISPELLGCGLVGAALAELMLAGRLGVEGDDLVALDTGAGSDGGARLDEVDGYVVEAVGSQPALHPVRSWIEPLQDGLYALVADAAVASGVVSRVPGGRRIGRGRQPDRFPAADLLAACRPQQHLEGLLRAPKDLTLAAGMLAALIGVLGIDGLLDPGLDRAVLRELLAEIEDHLPGDLRVVSDEVRTKTGEVSLRAR